MRWIALVLAPVAAQADATHDRFMDDLPTCVDAAADRYEASECISVYADTCMVEAEDGQSNLGMTACLNAEADAWDKLLNQEYRAALGWAESADQEEAKYFPEYANRVDTIRAAQRAWIAFRDANCEMAYGLWGSGSMRYPAHALCRRDMTAERTLDLRAYRTDMVGEW